MHFWCSIEARSKNVKQACVFSPGYEFVAASGVQRVHVTARVVKRPVPQVFSQLEGHLPLGQSHLFTVPHIHLTAKIKHQNLQHKKHNNHRHPVSTASNLIKPF